MVREENKYIERYVKRYAYLHEITLDIDSEYFITQIEKKLIQDNLNYLTNVKGKMTAWRAFKNYSNFQKVCKEGLIHLKERLNFGRVEITNAWGIKIEKGDSTEPHDHRSALCSGILYLNNNNQTLIFPDLKLNITPKKGTFVVFSPWLTHLSHINESDEIKYAIPFNIDNAPEKHQVRY